MAIREASRAAPTSDERRRLNATDIMPKPSSDSGERPILAITSSRTLGLVGVFLIAVASGFLFVVVHVWDDIDKHLERIDTQLSNLNVTQGKFEQFLTSELPGISQDLKRNTELMLKLETNMSALTESVSQVQRQVSIATEEIEKLKEAPMRKGSLIAPASPSAGRP